MVSEVETVSQVKIIIFTVIYILSPLLTLFDRKNRRQASGQIIFLFNWLTGIVKLVLLVPLVWSIMLNKLIH
jgi:hypothetical protein